MIAPTGLRRKRGAGGNAGLAGLRVPVIEQETDAMALPGRHRIVSGIIIPPNFRPPTALLNCDKTSLRWPGPLETGFLSPQPPGDVGIGPIAEKFIPILGQRELVLFLFGRQTGERFQAKACPRLMRVTAIAKTTRGNGP